MSQTSQPDGEPGAPVEELREDIAQTRQELGDTVQALAAKADVKSRAADAARHTAARARRRGQQVASVARTRGRETAGRVGEAVRRHPAGWAEIGAGVLAGVGTAVGVLAWRRRQRKPRNRAVRAWRAVTERLAR